MSKDKKPNILGFLFVCFSFSLLRFQHKDHEQNGFQCKGVGGWLIGVNWEVTGDSVNNTLRTFRVGKQNTEYSVFLFIKCHKIYPCVDSFLIKVSSEGEYRGKEREIGRERDG